jgi:dcuC protein
LAVTLADPQSFSKRFFAGMGNGYGEVLGIIIAAGVFAAGLKASGLIAVFIEVLRGSNEIARWGGSLGPFVMGVITGSGDAAAFAFNEAVTPHAPSFGMTVPTLGTMAALAGALGRTMSPISGVAIVICGLAGVSNPIELTKRLAIPMIIAVIFVALAMV